MDRKSELKMISLMVILFFFWWIASFIVQAYYLSSISDWIDNVWTLIKKSSNQSIKTIETSKKTIIEPN